GIRGRSRAKDRRENDVAHEAGDARGERQTADGEDASDQGSPASCAAGSGLFPAWPRNHAHSNGVDGWNKPGARPSGGEAVTPVGTLLATVRFARIPPRPEATVTYCRPL